MHIGFFQVVNESTFGWQENCQLASAGIPNIQTIGLGTCSYVSFFILIKRTIICISLS